MDKLDATKKYKINVSKLKTLKDFRTLLENLNLRITVTDEETMDKIGKYLKEE